MVTYAEAERLVKAHKEKEEKTARAAALKKNKTLIGRCFKYFNGNSDEKWWLYGRVVSITSDDITLDTAQEYFGNIEIERSAKCSSWRWGGGLDKSWISITEEEYLRETGRLLAKLGLERKRIPYVNLPRARPKRKV